MWSDGSMTRCEFSCNYVAGVGWYFGGTSWAFADYCCGLPSHVGVDEGDASRITFLLCLDWFDPLRGRSGGALFWLCMVFIIFLVLDNLNVARSVREMLARALSSKPFELHTDRDLFHM